MEHAELSRTIERFANFRGEIVGSFAKRWKSDEKSFGAIPKNLHADADK